MTAVLCGVDEEGNGWGCLSIEPGCIILSEYPDASDHNRPRFRR